MRYLFGVCFFFLFINPSFNKAEASSYLPVDHRVYDFLERMETLGIIPLSRLSIRPSTRGYAAMLLLKVNENKSGLSRVDKEELEFLLEEFVHELPRDRKSEIPHERRSLPFVPGFAEFLYSNGQNFYSSASENYTIFLDPVIIRSTVRNNSELNPIDRRTHIAGNGFVLRGRVGNIGYFTDVRDSKVWGTRKYAPNDIFTLPGTGFAAEKGDYAEFDETIAHLTWENGPIVLSYGRGKNSWGRGKTGSLALSSWSAPFDQLRMEARFRNFRFVNLLGELEQYPQIPKVIYKDPIDSNHFVPLSKYISAYRIEMDILDNLGFGLYHSVVFGDRPGLAGLNPLIYIASKGNADEDHNSVFGADFRYIWRGISIYGELLVDSVDLSKLGTNWHSNRFAYQVGIYYVEPFSIENTDIRIEYTRIEPWVYSHNEPISSWSNYGDCLGYQTGPNSDVLFFETRKRFTRKLQTSFQIRRFRHGANPDGLNIGGDFTKGRDTGDFENSRFLDGRVKKKWETGAGINYEIARNLFLHGAYTRQKADTEWLNIFRLSLELNSLY